MKKFILKLIFAVIAFALVVPLSAVAQAPTMTKKAKVGHSALTLKADQTPSKAEKRLPLPVRKIDNTVNGIMLRNRRAASARHTAYRIPIAETEAPSSPLMGSVLYADSWAMAGESQYGVYNLAMGGTVEQMFETSCSASYGGVAVDGKYYQTDMVEYWGEQYIIHEIYDLESGECIDSKEGQSYTELATDMTYDPTTATVYGCFYNEQANGFIFGRMDLDTYTTTAICDIEMLWNACACDAKGNLFAIDRAGMLYSVDKSTGVMTVIGDTCVEPYYTSSAVIDLKTGVMYWTVSPVDENGYLYTVDTTTGRATRVCQFEDNDEIAGLFFVSATAEDGAPAEITDLVADFADGALTGTISFTAPTTLFGGSAPTDKALAFTVLIDGETVAEGATEFGTKVSVDVTVAAAGQHTILAYVTNAVGDSPKAKVTMWIGNDSPLAPQNVSLTYADGTMTLTWDPVTEGKNGGHIGSVFYDVYRIIDPEHIEIVAQHITDCTFTEQIAQPTEITSYYYGVLAVADSVESDISCSNVVTLGSLSAPYSIDFTKATSLSGFTIIDANDDGKCWSLTEEGVLMTYNPSMDMDDWLITPPIKLEGGKIYIFSFVANAESNSYPERIEAAFADAPTVEALAANIIVQPETVDAEGSEFTATVAPATTGNYYFGIHGCSYADKYYLIVKSISLSAGVGTSVPATPADLKVIPSADGSNSAVVTFTSPDKCVDGVAVTSLVSATILVNGEAAATVPAPTPGAEVCQTISVDAAGVYTIGAYVTSEEGDGMIATVKAFIGINAPASPDNVQAQEVGNTGKVIVSWDAPTTDKDGYPINPKLITYTVVNYFDEVLAEGVTGTSVEIVAYEGDGQIFDYFDVTAVTAGGKSKPASSPMIAIGTPFEMPVVESFTDGDFDYGMGAIDNGASWYVFDLPTLSRVMDIELPDADDTNGLTMMNGSYVGAASDLFTGKINITGNTPVITFSYYTIADDDENYLEVYVKPQDGDFEQIGEAPYQMGKGEVKAWNTVILPLDQYKGKTVQIYFKGTIMTYTSIFLDAISVFNLPDYDLTVSSIAAPAKVAPYEEFDINVKVANVGAKAVDKYSIQLSLNGEVIDIAEGQPIAFGETASYSFAHVFTPVAAEENVFTATVVCADDENAANNSLEYPVILDIPNYPCAANLNAQNAEDGIILTWDEPDMNNLTKVAVTEDFEEYDAFSLEVGEWTLIDVDGAAVGNINGVDIPVKACAFFVMDDTNESTSNSSFEAHSGHKYLSTMYNLNGSQQSDWLISPELTGDAQTISFYAKSYTSNYGLETVSVYYSTTDKVPASFTKIETSQVPAEWTEYTAKLPSGAKYFAIVCESKDVFMLFVDDVTYIPANGESIELQLIGYNVYRDGVKINDQPVTETTYTADWVAGVHQYVVTVVYAEGESGPSNTVSLDSSISSTLIGTNIKVEGRTIVVTGAEGIVSVYTADGKTVYNQASAARNAVAVAPGVYVVKSGSRISKVVIR